MTNAGTENRCRCVSLQACLIVALALLVATGPAWGQTFVQQAQNTPGSGLTSTFSAAETAGDFNVVIVGWGDQTSSVNSVTDNNSNTYVLVGTSGGDGVSQAIYYANNISVSTNPAATITVTFFKNAISSADIRVLEYGSFSSTAVTVDNWIGNAGTTSPASSGTVTTSTSSLIVGAGTAVNQFLAGGIPPGLTSRTINGFGDIAMDSNAAVAPGNYHAGSNVTGGWVMQAVGFSVSGITGPAPTVTMIAPTSGSTAGGDAVTITGTGFLPGAVALFGTAPTGLSLVNCLVTSSTTMTCNTPAFNQGPKDLTVVNVDGKNGSLIGAFTYTINNPVISGISPATSTTDGNASITITGASFETGAGVTVGGALPPAGAGLFGDNVVVKSSNTITITSPALPTGSADVTVNNPDGGTVTSTGALTYALGTGPINYIQRGDAATGSSAQNVPVPMPNPQGKGNLNVAIIGWGDASSQVSSVTDVEGNTYVPALATVTGTLLSQVIYYAKNIKGDGVTPNTITVSFNKSVPSPDVRLLEYSGLDATSPVDQAVSSSGNGALADTGACTTKSATELIVAGATVSTAVTAAGPNFTTVDNTANGDNAEHLITSAIGSCDAQSTLSTGNWVIQSVSFKAAAGAAAGFTLTANAPTSATVTAGSNASYSLTLAALNGFNSPVTLACSGLPTGATCGFSPVSPVTPGSSTADTLTVSTSATTPAATSTVTITGTSGAISHTAQVSLTVTAATGGNFTVSAAPTTGTISSPGGSATSAISINATGGFAGAVSLACAVSGGGTPAPTCLLSPASISPGATSTLTVNTTANTASNSPQSTGLFYALLLPIGGMTLLGAGFTSRRKKLVGILLICMVIAGFVFMMACGGSSSSTHTGGGGGTPPGTYTVTVTGTSGTLAPQTATFTVTVQ